MEKDKDWVDVPRDGDGYTVSVEGELPKRPAVV